MNESPKHKTEARHKSAHTAQFHLYKEHKRATQLEAEYGCPEGGDWTAQGAPGC